MVTTILLVSVSAHAQEAEHSLYVESAQVVVNQNANASAAFILLQSTSINDIMMPGSLEQDIRDHDRVVGVVFTNVNACVLGVIDENCIIINMIRNPDEKDIITVQKSAKIVGDSFIGRLNNVFGTDATFHSVFVHNDDTLADALGLSGMVGVRNTVSAIYTMEQYDPITTYDTISSNLLAPGILNGGGFAEAAQQMAHRPDADVTFVAMPHRVHSTLQLKVTIYPNYTQTNDIDPMVLLGFDRLEQSGYLDGFYPLNSLVGISIITSNMASVIDTASPVLPSTLRNGNMMPDRVDAAGWVFDPSFGPLIRGTYILGSDGHVELGDAHITLGDVPVDTTARTTSGENYIVIIVIVIGGAAAAAFYLKGYRSGSKTRESPQQRR